MIPRSFFGRLAEPSPQQTERDLARLINRTAELAAAARHQLGFAAVNLGCDGVTRVTMFDGSSCQTSGDVCLATREEGITVCLDAPRGNGLNFQRVAFSAPDCSPVTGWWLVDSEGYMYRVPTALITAPADWPMSVDPAVPEPAVTLVRAGTWAKLMCAAALEIGLGRGPGSWWVNVGEMPGVWSQRHPALIGGDESGSLGDSEAAEPSSRGVLSRAVGAPNAGSRLAKIPTPPAGTAGLSTGSWVAYGYPFGLHGECVDGTAGAAPGTRDRSYPPLGTVETDCADRFPGDMVLVYRRGLGVQYAQGQVNLAGPDITDLNDYVSTAELDYRSGLALDYDNVNVWALPNGEVAAFIGDLKSGSRYRVRPAPDTAPTGRLIQQAKGEWGLDPNLFTEETRYAVAAWGDAATSFSVEAAIAGPTGPGRGCAVVLWEKPSGVDNYLESPHAYYGILGETIGGLTPIEFEGSTVVVASTAYTLRLTVIGPEIRLAYGYTFADANGRETALSPLLVLKDPPGPLYTPEITIPGGPAGTTVRRLYRLAWDYGSTTIGGPFAPVGPWAYSTYPGGEEGGVYDRMMRLVATVVATEAEPGTDPITIYDDDTSLSVVGTRPPSPLVYLGPITVDAPRPVYLLQPMHL